MKFSIPEKLKNIQKLNLNLKKEKKVKNNGIKVRKINSAEVGISGKFNIASFNEVIVHYNNGEGYSESINNLEVLIDGNWVNMSEAFEKHELITDNFNTCFFQPLNDDEKNRGYRIK